MIKLILLAIKELKIYLVVVTITFQVYLESNNIIKCIAIGTNYLVSKENCTFTK